MTRMVVLKLNIFFSELEKVLLTMQRVTPNWIFRGILHIQMN